MKISRRSFLKSTASTAIGVTLPAVVQQRDAGLADRVRLQLIRNATCIVRYGGKTLLIDPMLGDTGVMPPIDRSPNPRRNPLGPLPIPAAKLVSGIDATLVTHTHPDHWDTAARDLLGKSGTLFAQPPDRARFAEAGFTNIRPIETSLSWDGITIARTGGQHGRGDLARRLAPVSGYVLSRAGSPTIYIAGDTVWCPEVADAIRTHKPDVIVVNAGAAQFLEGGPITMDVDDVVNVCQAVPQATIVAVHMEAINHCVLTRDALRAGVNKASVRAVVQIPRDGEELRFG